MGRKVAWRNAPFRPRLGRVLIESRGVPGWRAHSVPADDDHVTQMRRWGGAGDYQTGAHRPRRREPNHCPETAQYDFTIQPKHLAPARIANKTLTTERTETTEKSLFLSASVLCDLCGLCG